MNWGIQVGMRGGGRWQRAKKKVPGRLSRPGTFFSIFIEIQFQLLFPLFLLVILVVLHPVVPIGM